MTELDPLLTRLADLVAARLADLIHTPTSEPWIGAREAAEHIGAPVSRVYDLAAQGDLHPARDGKRLAFRRSDLDAYMESHRDG